MADAGLTLFLIPLLVVVGFIGFFVIVATLIFRVLGKAIRALLGKPTGAISATRGDSAQVRPCRHVRCGHTNRFAARYCARCGRRLNRSPKGMMHD